MPFVYLLATLDTKGPDADFVRNRLIDLGVPVRLVDVGCLGEATVTPDVTRAEVFSAAGYAHADFVARADRGSAIQAAALGATQIIRQARQQNLVSGVLALGGSAGTTIGTSAMRALPLGVPKLMVSTLASGDTRRYVGDQDICMLNSVVDIAGLNRISRAVLDNAARAMAGMVGFPRLMGASDEKPLIAATMFGVTTPCVQAARAVLENAGCEVLIFHATGSGGAAMESLIRQGLISGVLDITTTELADEIVGGFLTAGPERLTAASELGVPQIVSVGATDMVNFFEPASVPSKFQERRFYQHNATTTLMRTSADENAMIGTELGRKVAASQGPAEILLPLRGVSALDAASKPFDDPAARAALFSAIRQSAGPIPCCEVDAHINDLMFAELAARKLLAMLVARPATLPADERT